MSGYVPLGASSQEVSADHDRRRPARLQKGDILTWFQQSSESDAAWVLKKLEDTLPHLLRDGLREDKDMKMEDPILLGAEDFVQQKTPDHDLDKWLEVGTPVIQFSSPLYFAQEGVDTLMMLDVVRIGNQEVISEVCYETQDDSAVHGRSYVATSGKLVFAPGVTELSIGIPIIDNDVWDTTTEFRCDLKEEGLKGATLGRYLNFTRVKIIDNNHFPTDDFANLQTPKDVEECPKWPLLFGYFRLVMQIPTVFQGSMKYILVDCVHNLWHLCNMLMTVYILDYVLDTSSPVSALRFIHDRFLTLTVYSAITLFVIAVLHVLDYRRTSFPVVGPTRCFIQSALFRKFLNFKKDVRESLSPGLVMMSIERDAAELATMGYLNYLKAFELVGQMMCTITFKVIAPIIFHRPYDWKALSILLFSPICLYLFMVLRQATTESWLHHQNMCECDVSSQLALTSSNYHLVIDYSLRNHCERKFVEKQKLYARSILDANKVLTNNMYFCRWCLFLNVAIWILYGGLQVINGSLTIGLFVANLRLFETFGHAFQDLYFVLIDMMHVFPALENVTALMNSPTDVQHRHDLKRAQRAHARELREKIMQEMGGCHMSAVPIDRIPIVLDFRSPFKFEATGTTLDMTGRVELRQGQLIAVVGPMGCGKATLLRLIAGSCLPADGGEASIFVPAHLRSANVADEPLFFGGTLFQNLIFGMDEMHPDASLERVKWICYRLTGSQSITDLLSRDECPSWTDVLSAVQCKLLMLARALIQNQELLCIQSPLAKLDEKQKKLVMGVLHEHIDRKGLQVGSDTEMRRTRTVVISASTVKVVRAADKVLAIDPKSRPCLRWIGETPARFAL